MIKTIEEAANSSDSVRRAVPRKERSAWRRIWEAYKADFKAARFAYEAALKEVKND
jgi:hypothetical protein